MPERFNLIDQLFGLSAIGGHVSTRGLEKARRSEELTEHLKTTAEAKRDRRRARNLEHQLGRKVIEL